MNQQQKQKNRKRTKCFLFFIFSYFILSNSLWAEKYKTGQTLCYGFPRVESLQTPSGVCVGKVLDSQDIPWKRPRKALALGNDLYISAFGGWSKGQGQIWKITLEPGDVQSIKSLFLGTDRSHGLRLGPDGQIYFGDATRILRFDPTSSNPREEVVINNLPDQYQIPSGPLIKSNHPLSEFIFLPEGHLVVNVGAPSNDCIEEYRIHRYCPQRDSQAELRLYHYDKETNQFDPQFTRIAKGLRNSMGLLYNTTTEEIYQAENGSDALGTPDELNVIDLKKWSQGKTYDFGWPFCYGDGLRYSGYENFKTFCGQKADRPLLLLPAHVAPLDMLVYHGKMFPEWEGKILMSWHGHRPSGSRLALFSTNEQGQPLPLTPDLVIDGWQEDTKGRHPKGRPVGLAINSEGALFVIDDQNETLLVVARSNEDLPPDQNENSQEKIKEEDLNQLFSQEQLENWNNMFDELITQKQCQTCHGDVVQPSPALTLVNMINQKWIRSPYAQSSEQLLWKRMTGDGFRIMPPPPMKNILEDKNAFGSLYQRLQNWLESLPSR